MKREELKELADQVRQWPEVYKALAVKLFKEIKALQDNIEKIQNPLLFTTPVKPVRNFSFLKENPGQAVGRGNWCSAKQAAYYYKQDPAFLTTTFTKIKGITPEEAIKLAKQWLDEHNGDV